MYKIWDEINFESVWPKRAVLSDLASNNLKFCFGVKQSLRKIFLEKNLKSYLHSLSLNLYMDKIEIYFTFPKIERK